MQVDSPRIGLTQMDISSVKEHDLEDVGKQQKIARNELLKMHKKERRPLVFSFKFDGTYETCTLPCWKGV